MMKANPVTSSHTQVRVGLSKAYRINSGTSAFVKAPEQARVTGADPFETPGFTNQCGGNGTAVNILNPQDTHIEKHVRICAHLQARALEKTTNSFHDPPPKRYQSQLKHDAVNFL